jgi:putative transposase
MEYLKPDTTYHIFNHANGFENVFHEDDNFRYFLEKFQLYITPIAETYAYCLMPNHFHLVVRIRKREVIEALIRNKNNIYNDNFSIDNFSNNNFSIDNFSKVPNFGKVISSNIDNKEIEKFLSKQFSNLFSSYTQSFNKVYKRMGSLFIKNFKREAILDKNHFFNVIIYTHRNPIHHGFCTTFTDWGYSSYSETIELKSKIVEVDKLIKIFGSKQQLIEAHKSNLDKFNGLTELEID